MAKIVSIGPALPADAVRRSKIDEYGEITRRIALHEPYVERAKVLKGEIEAWHKDVPGDVTIIDRGDKWEVHLSARRNERTIADKRKAFQLLKKALGMDGVIAVIEIGLGVLDKHVPKSAQVGFVTEERSGYRAVTPVALAPAIAFKEAA